jgi:hypothetical protein
MANIEFSYLYRDAGNYKNFNSIVFANINNVNIDSLEQLIRSKLIEGNWFYADQWLMPDLHFHTWNNFDHDWHEFESVTFTSKSAGFSVSLHSWMAIIQSDSASYK